MKAVGIIGNFGGDGIGGQIIKTRELAEAMEKQFGKINKVDVFNIKHNFAQLLVQIWSLLKQSDEVIIILASPGYFKILPVILFFNSFLKRNLYEIVIGGIRDQYIQKKKIRLKYEKKIKKIYVESTAMVKQYELIGLHNATYLPNFKNIEILAEKEMLKEYHVDGPLRLCTFSRIDRLKGIDVAIEVVKEFNNQYGENAVVLDIIGPIDEEYSNEFYALLQATECKEIRYCGKVDSSEAVNVLKKFDALLFPSKWFTEGFPGTFIDALASGLPILASYKINFRDIIEDGYNGYLISDETQIEGYVHRLWDWSRNREDLLKMKKNALMEAQKYTTEHVLEQIWSDMK